MFLKRTSGGVLLFLGLVCVPGIYGCSERRSEGVRQSSGSASRANATERHASLESFIKIRWPVSADLAPDGTLYYIYNPDGINQLYQVPPGGSQDDAVKLTNFPDGISGYDLSDDGAWIAVTASVGGSEQDDIYLISASTREMEPLYVNPKVVYDTVVWRRDSRAFAYHANDESSSDFHIYLHELGAAAPRKILAQTGSNQPVDFNRTGTKLVVLKYNSASFSQLFEIDLDSGAKREITPAGEEWSFEPIGYTADERAFLVITDYQGDLKQVHSIDLASGAITAVLTDLAGFEVDNGLLNEDRTVLAVAVNEDGYSTLRLRRATDFAPMDGPQMDRGVVGNLRFSGKHMLYSMDNANTPGVVFRWDLSAAKAAPATLTHADTQGIDVTQFRLPELVKYSSFDGRAIPAFIYLPADYRPGRPIPFIVQYHGGPEAQFRPNFNRSFQYFVSRGYGVMAPNVRGSSGYGKEYIEADNYKNRMKSVQDGVFAARFLVDQGYAEPKRIASWGGSYGGFMVMATITEAPELFGAACNVVGVVNFQTFLEQTKDYRRKLREMEYGPLSDPEFLKSISPIHKVDRIDTPLMIAHGLNDPRVPVGEAMQVAVALKKRGLPVEELYFPDEGHGFAKEENRLLYYEQMAAFFDRHLQ